MLRDLHLLPKTRDSWSYLYLEHTRIEQEHMAIAAIDATGKTPIPTATLSLLMLGPGTSITHAAIHALTMCGCTVLWVGEQGVRCYAMGLGETRSASNLYRQARLWGNPDWRGRVVRAMYEMRFAEALDPSLTLQQIRGKEGVRVREAYASASHDYDIVWQGRSYARSDWNMSDPVNRALSAANSCLYGVCHAAILSAGYSPALGFIHTGKQLSFVYDVGDLYKVELTIPAAFAAVAESGPGLEGRVRRRLRDQFHEQRLLPRIIDDIARVLTIDGLEDMRDAGGVDAEAFDEDLALPGGIWDPIHGAVSGGVNYGEGSNDYRSAAGVTDTAAGGDGVVNQEVNDA
jgi:CRISP-associated protein Cas1